MGSETAEKETAKPIGQAQGGEQQPFHLDPTKNTVDSVIRHFNNGETQAGTAELKALQDIDNHGYGPAWQRHIAVINSAVDLNKLGMADADQLLGVAPDGSLITADKKLMKEQYRSPNSLAVKSESYLFQDENAVDQVMNTNTYKRRLVIANEMEANPQCARSDSAEQVKSIIADFNSGNIKRGSETLQKLQNEDLKQEPEMWVRHSAAINANINLNKMGLGDAGQILSVDDKGRLVTASKDLQTQQVRSLENPSKIAEQKELATSSFLGITYGGDSKTFAHAKEVADLLKGAEEARKPLTPGDHQLTFTSSAGEQRQVDVHVPPGYDPAKGAPTFYVLHNALMGGDVAHGEMNNETYLNEKADKQGFIVVYPIAETHSNDANSLLGGKFQYHSWNSPGAGMNVTYGNYDDVDYLKESKKLIDGKMNTTGSPHFLVGFSEGGEFAPHAASKMPGEWDGVFSWHPTRMGKEAVPKGDPFVYAQITGEKDGMLPRYGGTTDMLFDVFGSLYPKLAKSEPTAAFDSMAKAQGCEGTPKIDKSDPRKVVTEYTATQCKSGRPVIDVDMLKGEHAVDGDTGNWMTRVMGWVTGSKIRDFDSTQYMIDTMMANKRNPGSKPDLTQDSTSQEFRKLFRKDL